MKIKKIIIFNSSILFLIFINLIYNLAYAQKAYFDLSQNEINIDTDFKGQELILFGLTDPDYNIIIIIRGPKENLTVRYTNKRQPDIQVRQNNKWIPKRKEEIINNMIRANFSFIS